MANAATLLADLLTSWRVPSQQTPESVRGQNRPDWDEVLKAVGYIQEVETHLDESETQGREVGFYRALLPKAKMAVLGFEPAWGSMKVNHRPLLDVSEMGLLRSLGQLIDALPGVATVSSENRIALAERFEVLALEVEGLTYLSSETRAYLVNLLNHAAATVRLTSTSDAGVRDAALRVAGAFSGVAQDTRVPDDRRGWWREQAAAVSTGLVTNGAWAILTLGASAVVNQIGS